MAIQHCCAHVGGKYPVRADFLTYGADLIAGLGFTAIKLFLSSDYAVKYPNQTWSGTHTTLTALIQDPAFVTVLSDARFTTFLLNPWTFTNGIYNPWVTNITEAQLSAEYTEMKTFVEYLLTTYPGKTFHISNSEADWSLQGSFSQIAEVSIGRCERMAAFLRRQQKAVNDARSGLTSTARVLHSVEVNLALDEWGRRLIPDVLPIAVPDAVSFSSYESINTTYANNQATSEAEIERRLKLAAAKVQAVLPGIPMLIGEYGFNENEASFIAKNLDVGGLMQRIFDVANALNMSLVSFWNITDNEEQSPGVPRGYYIYKPDTLLSAQGAKYASILP